MANEDLVVEDAVIDEIVKDEVAVVDPVVSEVEQKARKMGWTEKSEFRGDPDKWRPADEFVERGENMLPIIKAQVKRQDREIAELKDALQKFGEYSTKTEQRAYEKAYNELREQRAQAIASGDGATFDKVDGEIDALKEEIKASQNKVKTTEKDSESDPVYVEWKSRNAWVNDTRAEKWAFDYGNYLISAGKAERGIDVFEKISKAARSEFPDKFNNPRRDAAPSVEGGVPAARKGGRSYADIPASDRSACERMAKNGFPDDEKAQAKFKAEYTKTYFEGV